MPNYDAELSGGKGGDAEIDVHFAAGDNEVFDLADIFANHDAGDHRGKEIKSYDTTVHQPGEMSHENTPLILCLPCLTSGTKLTSLLPWRRVTQ